MKINFKLLSSFLAVAQNASFRKAAEQSHLSLPAVSMQVKQLEEQLGVALFQRTTRKVELTREGEQLMISARKAMAELESGLAHIQQAADVSHGRLAFACVPTIASSRLPPILTRFARSYPGITLHVREVTHQELLEAVRRREVDFGIGPVAERRGELDFAPIFVDDYCALVPRSLAPEGRDSITLRELARLPLLTMSSSTIFREHLDRALETAGLVAATNYEFTSASTLVAMAEAGLGVAVLGRVAIPRRTTLRALRITAPALTRAIAIVTIRGHSLSPAASRLVELCNRMLAPAAVA